MRFYQTYVKNVHVEAVEEEEIRALAAVLLHQPIEVLLTGYGVVIPPILTGKPRQALVDGRRAAAGLARRNIRSLVARSRDIEEVSGALIAALQADPAGAEDALEDAGLEMNLRYSIFATPDAALLVENGRLTIKDRTGPGVRVARKNLRQEARGYFCPEALGRLSVLDVEEICFAPTAIQPLFLQLEPGGLMAPDTAHQHLHKGSWRVLRKPDFVKDYCVACGRCFIHCPDNAVIHAPYDKLAKGTTGILGIDTDRCTACGLCAAVCPTNRDGYKGIVMIAAEAHGTPEAHCVG